MLTKNFAALQDVLDQVSAEIEHEEELRAQHANQKKQVC